MSGYTIFVDVEDLFQYCEANPRPSGIQRQVFELLKVLPGCASNLPTKPKIVFVRQGASDPLLEVKFDAIHSLFENLTGTIVKESGASKTHRSASLPLKERVSFRQRLQRLRHHVIFYLEGRPAPIADPLLRAGVFQIRALRLARREWQKRHKTKVVPMAAAPAVQPVQKQSAPPQSHASSRSLGKPGDIFLILGAPWAREGFGERLRVLRDTIGLRPVLLVYDLIPVRRPEWCAHSLVTSFSRWLEETLPHCADLMAISDATARDVNDFVQARGLTLQQPIRTVPLGTGFGAVAEAGQPSHVTPGLPKPGSYVLFVSTIEARKNHILLFRVWSRLLRDKPRSEVPTLVFAGRVGWLVADLMQQLENTEYLSGAIRLIADPTDAELMSLYEGCRFTVFPSLFEGWGLPVSESLALGRPCVASHATAIPEAGGELTRYFDPENEDDAYRVLRSVIEDEAGLDAWRTRVRKEFVPTPWSMTAAAVLKTCECAVSGVKESAL
ncbi:glycosyltransferase family 4 protein [Kozakia baliensis]|uniref:glycosyltransferase family 4 protein n=1 Tax=Kozakia baliensis TaxID=153496 RepID=UPI00087D116B|nr:glycosyltransferase family 1 protein [Kozakia baliensis]AOX19114.1 hypothetical protein A0U90_01075 [Kozakia baliensis]